MDIRFVTKQIHSYLDYPVAITLLAAPFLLPLGLENPIAKWLSVAVGGAAFVLALLTNHGTGVFKVLPYSVHLAVDFIVGVLFLAAPFVMGFEGIDMWYYLANGAAVFAVVSLHKPERVTEPAIA